MKMNKKVMAFAGLGALVLVGGTFAYFNQSMSLDNPLDTGKYNTQLVEDFTPPDEGQELKPGQRWEKDVWTENTGDYPVLVRIRMDERWARKGTPDNFYKVIGSVNGSWDGTKKEFVPSTSLGKDAKFLEGTWNDTDKTFDAIQRPITSDPAKNEDSDGLTPAEDGTVIYKNIVNSDKWIDGKDGYWYWNGVLDKNGKTDLILNGLVVAKDIDLGKYDHKEYYAVSATQPAANDTTVGVWNEAPQGSILDWSKTVLSDADKVAGKKLWRKSESNVVSGKQGYADSVYTLTITSDFVQATKEAVESSWNTSFDQLQKIIPGVKIGDDNVTVENVSQSSGNNGE